MTTYKIKTKTGDRLGTGTNANIEIVLFDGSGKHTKPAKLDNWFGDDFERGNVDVFTIKDDTDIPEVTEIKLRRDAAGLFSDWYVDRVEVLNKNSKTTSVFPVLRWIRSNVDLFIGIHDTFLPQFDPRLQQRNAELQEKRTLYEYEEKIPGLPLQVFEAVYSSNRFFKSRYIGNKKYGNYMFQCSFRRKCIIIHEFKFN